MAFMDDNIHLQPCFVYVECNMGLTVIVGC